MTMKGLSVRSVGPIARLVTAQLSFNSLSRFAAASDRPAVTLAPKPH
jgi:hypothetical protein